MNLIVKIVIAVVIAALVGLILSELLGPVLIETNVDIVQILGRFFKDYGFFIGVLVGLLWFWRGGTVFGTRA